MAILDNGENTGRRVSDYHQVNPSCIDAFNAANLERSQMSARISSMDSTIQDVQTGLGKIHGNGRPGQLAEIHNEISGVKVELAKVQVVAEMFNIALTRVEKKLTNFEGKLWKVGMAVVALSATMQFFVGRISMGSL